MDFHNHTRGTYNYNCSALKRWSQRSLTGLVIMLMTFKLFPQVVQEVKDENSPEGKTVITWVASMPDKEGKNSKNFISRLGDIVFGEEPALLVRPVAVAASATSGVWIADQGKGEIVFAGNGKSSLSSLFNQKEERLSSLAGICVSSGERILFTDSGNDKLYVKNGKSFYKQLCDTIQLAQPTGIAWSSTTDEIWVIETKAHCISILSSDGIRLRRIGSRGTANGEFNFPTHIWIDGAGRVYITDAMNYRIQVFDSKGNYIFSFGEQGDATGYFARPKGVATDSHGNIYVADALFNAIQVFDETGKFLHYFGNQGAERGEFWMPNGIFIDKKDFLYIADSYNSRIQVFKIEYK